MKFIAYISEESACDYTIGCGNNILILDSTGYDDAVRELQREIIGIFDDESGKYEYEYPDLEEVTLYEISNETEMPIEKWYLYAANREESSKEEKQREKRLRQYKSLKLEFE